MEDRIYAVHWHQKQKNADKADVLIVGLEGFSDAVFKFLGLIEDHGILRDQHQILSPDDCDDMPEFDLRDSVARFLRSDEFYIESEEWTDEPELDGALEFRLVNPEAKDVSQRRIALIVLKYSDNG